LQKDVSISEELAVVSRAVDLPPRLDDLAGDVLATAIRRCVHEAVPIDEAVRYAAPEQGRRIVTQLEEETGAQPSQT